MLIRPGDKVLFIGDSITDAGRREDKDGLGHGYVRMFRDLIYAHRPELDAAIVNRGISGNTTRHLKERWTADVIAEKPDVLSICIGVNDVWRQLQEPRNPEEVLIDEYEAIYRELIERTKAECGSRLILCEAGIIGETRDAPHNGLMIPYNKCVARLAVEYKAALAPINQAFWRAIDAKPGVAWTGDGVHPLSNGHMLMALTVYEAMGGFEAV